MENMIPAPKFNHFERVVVTGDGEGCRDFHGKEGVVIWLASSAVRRNPATLDQWLYVVYLPTYAAYRSFKESELESVGGLDPDSAHYGERPEISFDLVIEEDNDWMEGSYRLPGEFWKVVIFQKDDVEELQFQASNWKGPTQWEHDITGVVIRFPRNARIGRDDLLNAMSQAIGVKEWVQIQGPDSMMLR